MLQRLLVATASVASFVTATPSSTNVELHELAGFVSSSLGHDKAEDRQRLSLRHLESMWHTSLGEEVRWVCGLRLKSWLSNSWLGLTWGCTCTAVWFPTSRVLLFRLRVRCVVVMQYEERDMRSVEQLFSILEQLYRIGNARVRATWTRC